MASKGGAVAILVTPLQEVRAEAADANNLH